MSAALKHPFDRMTLDEFLVWDAPGPERWQLVDGQVQAMAPTLEAHGLLQAEIGALLRNHLLEQQSSCRVVVAPGVVPQVGAANNFRIPDLGVTCSMPLPGSIGVDPVLLVEVLSPSNERDTRANVWAYTTIPSVQEILLVRVSRMEAELLRRGTDGNWPAKPLLLWADDTLALESIGFRAPLPALYRTTGLPAVT